MKYFVTLFIIVNTCLHTKAQFHTIASRPLQYKVEILKDRPKSETVNVKDSLAMVGKKEKSIDKEKWLERNMSVSLPQKRVKVTSPYGMRKDPMTGIYKKHNGVDLRARKAMVYSMFPGIVHKVGYDERSGNYVIIQHGEIAVSYCHLSKILIIKGSRVHAHDVIGISGNTGRSTGEHLHVTCKMKGTYINPEIIFQYIRNILDSSENDK
ncbi:MAG: M23 family metallopeptidase [Bacteroidaceae bacterium]|nr:M23 family metallopeptidase [Bacteroidaceae bacterium]